MKPLKPVPRSNIKFERTISYEEAHKKYREAQEVDHFALKWHLGSSTENLFSLVWRLSSIFHPRITSGLLAEGGKQVRLVLDDLGEVTGGGGGHCWGNRQVCV